MVRCRNLLVDGEIVLSDGRLFVIEVKLRMNWAKACQSNWQIRQFLQMNGKPTSADGAIVFFEEFSGDWDRSTRSRGVKRGWENWYRGHADVGVRGHESGLRVRDR